jgi:hypothetical protein
MAPFSKTPIFLLAAALLGGCATRIPEGTPTAMVRFTSNVPVMMSPICGEHVRAVKNGLIHNQFWNEESPVKMIGTQPGKRNDVLERLVPAESEFGIKLGASTNIDTKTTATCVINVAFTPSKGEQYQIDYDFDVGRKVCTARIYRLSAKNGKTEPIKWRKFKDELTLAGGGTCENR